MDATHRHILARLLRLQRVAALGTLRDGAPFVSMVAFATAADLSALYLHLSRLAPHTRAILADPRVGLMIAEPDDGSRDPQTLARVSIQATVMRIDEDDADHDHARSRYLARLPDSAQTFQLGDFALFRATPSSGRLVAGFARTFNVTADDIAEAATVPFDT